MNFLRALPGQYALWSAGRKERNGRRQWERQHLRFRPRVELLENRLVLSPTVVDPNLAVRTVVSGLTTPISMAFLGDGNFFILEKNTGQVKHVVNGAVQSTVLDLAVNFGSERGLLGIALHPDFPDDRGVYLYWTESSTGADTDVLADTPLLGNRVDRYVWNGSTLTFDRNLIHIRAIQQDANQAERGNHDGGVLRFGPDGKLYIYIGDLGRRGQMQNLPDGPGPGGTLADDQFGGPEPDDEHLSGVILRLNDDGSTPTDNPFFTAGALRGGEAGANLQKVFAYGIRNGFGMAFDPVSGNLWEAQNGDDSFTELNLVESAANLGWVQVMGLLERINQFKAIETSNAIDPVTNTPYFGLQQVRWSPVNIADTAEEALARLFMIFEGGDEFAANLEGSQEVPPVNTTAAAAAEFTLNDDGTLSFKLVATADIQDATQAHIHLGARGQNGPVVAFLFGFDPAGVDFAAGDTIGEGTLDDDDVIALPGFDGTVASLVERMRQSRTYANLHTLAFPGGEIRGQIFITDREPVSHYSDPEFSWKFEVSPAGIGFLNSRALGPQYQGDLFTGAARTFLRGGQLFHFNLTGNRQKIAVDDPRLRDRVADNNFKFDLTESESLLFGENFGIGTDIQTGPNGNLFVVSLSNGEVYEIFRVKKGRSSPRSTPGGNLVSALIGDTRRSSARSTPDGDLGSALIGGTKSSPAPKSLHLAATRLAAAVHAPPLDRSTVDSVFAALQEEESRKLIIPDTDMPAIVSLGEPPADWASVC
jgi:glucose/arabinose dehydrogenase